MSEPSKLYKFKPKLILSIILSVFVYIWIDKIFNQINLLYFQQPGHYVIFIKPLFVYLAGLIIINKI